MPSDDGHQEIQQQFKSAMNLLARDLDRTFNGPRKGKDRITCFVLLVAPFDGPMGQRTNYISNGNRDDVVQLMKEITARFEEQAGAEREAQGRMDKPGEAPKGALEP